MNKKSGLNPLTDGPHQIQQDHESEIGSWWVSGEEGQFFCNESAAEILHWQGWQWGQAYTLNDFFQKFKVEDQERLNLVFKLKLKTKWVYSCKLNTGELVKLRGRVFVGENKQVRMEGVLVQTGDLAPPEEGISPIFFEQVLNENFIVTKTDTSGKITYVNEKFCEISGFSQEEIVGQSYDRLNYRPHTPAFLQEMEKTILSGKSWRGLICNQSKDQDLFWLDTTIIPILNHQHEVVRLMLFQSDITNQKCYDDILRSQKFFYESILENTPNMIFVKDANELRFKYFNKAGEEILGMKREELLNKNDYDFFPKEQADFFTGIDRDVLATSRKLTIPEEPIKTAYGIKYLSTRKFVIYNEQNHPEFLVGISDDITEKKKIEADLVEERAKVIQASKLSTLGEMAGGMAHEINNPLAIIKGLAWRLNKLSSKENGIDAAMVKKLCDDISKAVERAAQIILGLRIFARDAHADEFTLVPLRKIVNDTLVFCQGRFDRYNIRLEVDVPEGIEISCREVQISQVLLNLLTNAFDAITSREGDVDFTASDDWVRVSARLHPEMSTVIIKIEDTGPGIQDEVHRKIFDPFFTTKEIGKGTGLGLSISKGIIESHHGQIELTRAQGPTTFEISLPVIGGGQENQG